MKKLGLILSIFISLILCSCDSVLGVQTQKDYFIRVQNVETKTTYNSFDHLKNPVLFQMQVRDFGENYKGGIVIIFDTETNSIFDYVYVPEISSALDPIIYSIKPAGYNNVCYISGQYGCSNVAFIDPAKTSVQLIPKRRSGYFNEKAATTSAVPSKQLISRTGYGFTDKQGILVNLFDVNTGETEVTLGIESNYPYYSMNFYPFSDDRYYFIRDDHAILNFSYIDLAKNSYVDVVELINERPPLEEDYDYDEDSEGDSDEDFDSGEDFEIPAANISRQGDATEEIHKEPGDGDEEIDPLAYIWSDYLYNIVYMNDKQIIVHRTNPYSGTYKHIYKDEDGNITETKSISDDCFLIIDRTSYEMTEISMYDYLEKALDALITSYPNEGSWQVYYDLYGVFEVNGKFYCLFHDEKTEGKKVLRFAQIDFENKTLIELSETYDGGYGVAFHKVDNKLYFVNTDEEIALRISYYDFDTNLFYLLQNVNKETFGFPLE